MLLLKCLPQLQAKMNASSKGGARGTWVQTLKSAEVPFPLSACCLSLKWGYQYFLWGLWKAWVTAVRHRAVWRTVVQSRRQQFTPPPTACGTGNGKILALLSAHSPGVASSEASPCVFPGPVPEPPLRNPAPHPAPAAGMAQSPSSLPAD